MTMIKKGIRILAIDGSAFGKRDGDSLVVGVIGRGDEVEGVLSFRVDADGADATKKLIDAAGRSRFSDQIRLVAIHGITLAGLNIVDITHVSKMLEVPVVGVVRKKPDRNALERAVRASKNNAERKLEVLKGIRENAKTVRRGGFYFQCVGIPEKDLREVSDSAIRLLRLAHLIASGVRTGESKGRM